MTPALAPGCAGPAVARAVQRVPTLRKAEGVGSVGFIPRGEGNPYEDPKEPSVPAQNLRGCGRPAAALLTPSRTRGGRWWVRTGGRDGPDDRGVVGAPGVRALRPFCTTRPTHRTIFSPDTSVCYRIRHPPGAAFAPTEFGAQRETWVRMVDGVCR